MERHEAARGGGRAGSGCGETVQEALSVGKRKVASGGVRVTTRVSERPVQRTVTLREESVEAEAAFEERTVEVLGTSEEAVVRKEARVVGEVSLGKRVEEREETVRDTVRKTKVEVEEVAPAASRKAR
jgi:stress response protein YsnF